MPPWERYNPNAEPTAAATPSGPWSKFAAPAAKPETKWREPGMIVPVQFSEDGQARWATPQIVAETIKAIQAPGKALQGEYGMEIDPATGRPTTITNEMIGDTLGTAGLGLTPMNPAAQVGARFGAGAIKPAANKIIRRELDAAQIPVGEVGPRLQALGPDAMLGDLSPGLRARTAAVATMPGNGAKTVVDALSARRAGSNSRIIADVDGTLGPAPVPSYVHAELDASRKALSPRYKEVLSGSEVKAVDTSKVAEDLDSMAVSMRGTSADTARSIRKMLDVTTSPEDRAAGQSALTQEWKAAGSVGPRPVYQPPLDPNPETLLEVRKTVGGMLEAQQKSMDADPTVVGTLKYIYAQLDRQLTEAVPGIKDVDAIYQDLSQQKKGIDLGQELLESGRTAKRPEEVADLMNGPRGSRRLGPDEQGPSPLDPLGGPVSKTVGPSMFPLRLRQGTRAEIDRLIGTNIRDINALKRVVAGEGNWNRDRLATIFGEEKAARLLQILEREAAYNATEEMALSGSRTQVLKAAQEDIAGKGPRPNPVRSAANFRFGDAVADAADRSLGWLYAAKRGATNDSLAEALTARPDNLQMLSALGQPTVGPVVQGSSLATLRMLAQQPR